MRLLFFFFRFFFFQAEDGIRDYDVTGVQTCALPILFKYRSKSRERRSLIIFLTPRIVRSTQDTEFLLQQELQRRRVRLHDEIEALVNPK